MSSRFFRTIAATLIVLLFGGTSVQAGPLSIREAVLILGRHQNSRLELRQVSHSRVTLVGDVKASTQERAGAKQGGGKDSPNSTNGTTTVPTTNSPGDSILPAVEVSVDESQGTVSVINQGDVEGTICDCGEIIVPGGGLPKWPLVFLGAIPLFFLPHHGQNSSPAILPGLIPITAPVAQVPEPSSLLLMISGLTAFGIGWRRRRIIANRMVEKTGVRNG